MLEGSFEDEGTATMKILCDFSDNAAFAAGWSGCRRHPTQHLALVLVIANPDHRE
jgi:hypothetical protein